MSSIISKALLLTALTILAACSGTHNDLNDRPGDIRPAVNAELEDASMRISGQLLNLNYSDGGVMFSRSTDGVINAVRLDDGTNFEYNPAIPSLTINGVATEIGSAELQKRDGSTEWHCLTLADGVSQLYIVVDL